MKNRSVQAMSIGLTALALVGPTSVTAYAMSAEENTDVEATNTQQETSQSEQQSDEQTVAEDISNLSEQFNNTSVSDSLEQSASDEVLEGEYNEQIKDISKDENTAKDAVQAGGTSMDNVAKASEAIDKAVTDSQPTVDEASAEVSASIQTTEKSVKDAQAAVETVTAETTSQEVAVAIVAELGKNIEDAEVSFESAVAKYEAAVEEYNLAKEDYEVALAAYNSNKENAKEAMTQAENALEAAQSKLEKLEEQLNASKDELAATGADVILSAEENKATDTATYVATVLEHYYIPSTEQLEKGQSTANFVVDSTSDSAVSVKYDILSEDGSVLRTVNADYGYTVDSETGEVDLFTRDLSYEYVNAKGEVVSLTKEEAKALNGKVEIENYWSIDGYYVPTYKESYSYTGTRSGFSNMFRGGNEIADGKDYVDAIYNNSNVYSKANIKYNNDWKTDRKFLGFSSTTTGSYSVTYNKANEKNGYKVSEQVASTKFDSEKQAYDAVTKQAKQNQSAYTIDKQESRLNTTHEVKYADVVEKYINVGDVLWKNTASGYTTYLGSLKARVEAYDRLLQTVANAKDEYKAAQQKVSDIKKQITELKASESIESAVELLRLELQLDNAKADCSTAKSNLDSAKENLSKAKSIVADKYAKADSSSASANQSSESSSNSTYVAKNYSDSAAEIQEETVEEPEEIIEEEVLTETPTVSQSSSNTGSSSASVGDVTVKDDEKVEDKTPKEIEIPEEKVPLSITVAGLLQRKGWFVGLAGVSAAGAGVAFFEAKRRAAAKIIDKLNQ